MFTYTALYPSASSMCPHSYDTGLIRHVHSRTATGALVVVVGLYTLHVFNVTVRGSEERIRGADREVDIWWESVAGGSSGCSGDGGCVGYPAGAVSLVDVERRRQTSRVGAGRRQSRNGKTARLSDEVAGARDEAESGRAGAPER